MIIDVNTYLGHWPFRNISHNTAEALVSTLEKSGVDKACVSSLNAIFYKDTQAGNLELSKEIKGYENHLIPFAIINPSYVGWKEDFMTCINVLHMKGLELYPYYHGYQLTDPFAVELISLAAKMKIPVHLPCAIENIRQKHPMDTDENLSVIQVKEVLELCDEADFIISNGSSHSIAESLESVMSSRSGSVYFDFARVEVFTEDLDKLIKIVSTDKVVFGSVAPFQYIAPQTVKLKYLKTGDVEKIRSGNLVKLLRLQ